MSTHKDWMSLPCRALEVVFLFPTLPVIAQPSVFMQRCCYMREYCRRLEDHNNQVQDIWSQAIPPFFLLLN